MATLISYAKGFWGHGFPLLSHGIRMMSLN